MTHFRFHLCALPHLPISKKNSACAYTIKIWHMSEFLMSLGHEVFLYGVETPSDELPPCTEFIQTISQDEVNTLYGEHPKDVMFPISWDINKPYWQLTNAKCIAGILKRKQPKDFILVSGGNCQKPIADAMPQDMMTVEPMVGYHGVFSRFKVFESYTHMSVCQGHAHQENNPQSYDWVIPPYLDPKEFPFQPTPEGYLVYVGRMTKLKGVEIAINAAKANDMPILLAGQGVISAKNGKITTKEWSIYYPKATYLGTIGVQERIDVMGKANACFVPSQYIEPGGNVVCEAQSYGVPVITSDWGVFGEAVEVGKTGLRCRTLKHFIDAVPIVQKYDRKYIHDRAISLWSTERIKWMFQEYFERLYDLWQPEGWNYLGGVSNPDWQKPGEKDSNGRSI